MKRLSTAAMLILIAGCASTRAITLRIVAPGMDFASAPMVEIRLFSFHFAPDVVRLRAGQPYALKLVNASSMEHTFTAPELFAAARVAPEDAGRIAAGQIELPPGGTVVLHIVPTAGEYRVVCTEFGHALLGMRGKLVVN